MKSNREFKVIAKIHTDFPTKFGIPRQSGLVSDLKGKIVFEREYRNAEALRGLEGFSHLWLLWEFSEIKKQDWTATVRPPRLGGNKRMGVFATRSPYRPNPIGLSSVKIEKIEFSTPDGPVIWVSGADILDKTPIFDIKPYIAYTDSHPEATGGFSESVFDDGLEVVIDQELSKTVKEDKLIALKAILAQDPRPAYQDDQNRVYSFEFSNLKVSFKVAEKILTVVELSEI